MAFAGVWDRWHNAKTHQTRAASSAVAFESCAIITVMANDVIARVSDRMPAILTPDAQERWLDRWTRGAWNRFM